MDQRIREMAYRLNEAIQEAGRQEARARFYKTQYERQRNNARFWAVSMATFAVAALIVVALTRLL